MHKIFVVGKEPFKKDYKIALESRGYKTKSFGSLDAVLQRLNENADLLIVDRKHERDHSFKELMKLSKNIPKIIISDSDAKGSPMSWLKEPLTYPLHAPSARELGCFVNGLLREREILLENKRLKSDLSATRRELNSYEEVCKTLVSSVYLKDILPPIMKKAKDMIKAKSWSLLLVDEETGELVFEKAGGMKTLKSKVKIGEGIAGWVAQKGRPVLVTDLSQDKRFRGKIDRSLHSKTKSLICVPIKSRDQLIGVLEVADKTTEEPFAQEDLDLLMKFVDQLAIAIERVSLYQKVAELRVTDDLTKLFNTNYLNRTLDMEIKRSSRYYTSVSLIFMDIDFFRKINDRYGHLVGSKVLIEMGQLLLKNLRAIDVVARFGGDEFVIVLPQTSPSSAAQIAERIRRAIERRVFLKEEGYSLKVTASFGVASFPESAKTKEELLKLADEAMYKVKHHSRNGVYALI